MGTLKMAFVNEFENRRTIDHESGAYLVYEGGTPERGLERFSFYWKGEKIPFYAQEKQNEPGDNSWNSNIHWTFSHVQLPRHMQDQREEINDMIKHALEAHGFGYNREKYNEVTAECSLP